ncbi:hypothetical protein NEOLEDRAFT_1102301 [Neolentinus lepideus HHB14362 ss-1]|uniref:Anti-proliferative protein domain-containing protein n=1 Tax=Neolentinus lepideus HHB14362 ss-1 TaxID=1314782 RepID=A0A165NAG5_9AGAM|nr:hypothetical protein NEOLEDRAFT_1102301 [Neolentinus lepideus HHB14362 ss-1]
MFASAAAPIDSPLCRLQLVRPFFILVASHSSFESHLIGFTKTRSRISARIHNRNYSISQVDFTNVHPLVPVSTPIITRRLYSSNAMAVNVPLSMTLSVTVAHVVTYLTHSLIARIPASTILKLQACLETNLSTHFAPTWDPSNPVRGSGRRCLTLSPHCVPPRPVYAACIAADVDWSVWIKALGNIEFDLFVDPGSVSVRFGQWGMSSKLFTVWCDQPEEEEEAKLYAQLRAQATARLTAALTARQEKQESPKTLAQQLLEEDQEEIDDEIFAMLADETREPTWLTPILDQFPDSVSPVSTHSRSSSCSSHSESSGFSFSSASSETSVSTASNLERKTVGVEPKLMSRRERARQARVFIDKNRKEVTSYEGGRTTVLTGGVMLGAPANKVKATQAPKVTKVSAPISPISWRRI